MLKSHLKSLYGRIREKQALIIERIAVNILSHACHDLGGE